MPSSHRTPTRSPLQLSIRHRRAFPPVAVPICFPSRERTLPFILGHGGWIEGHLEALRLGVEELLKVVLGAPTLAACTLFQSREVSLRARNEPDPPRNRNPIMARRGVVERDKRILPHSSLGFRLGSNFVGKYVNCNHASMVTRIGKLSNGKYKYPPTFLYQRFGVSQH